MLILILQLILNVAHADSPCEKEFNIKKLNQVIIEDQNESDWTSWNLRLKNYRKCTILENKINLKIYQDEKIDWGKSLFRQYFIFMYDKSFQENGKYKTISFLNKLKEKYGHVDSVLLWHAYPQLGFDTRTQFDFYKQMPGGLLGLRKNVVDIFHQNSIRVFINFNPWDIGTYTELGNMVKELDIDGVMLDTMDNVPKTMVSAINKAKQGVILMPETTPSLYDHSFAQGSWAQWYEIPKNNSSILFQKWIIPTHQLYFIRRWDSDRRDDINYSFFNASGMLIWDNVFGTWNPYSYDDRLLLAQTGILLKEYAKNYFQNGEWLPLVPTNIPGLDLNIWKALSGETFAIIKNNLSTPIEFQINQGVFKSQKYFVFWQGREINSVQSIIIPPHKVEAMASDLKFAKQVYKIFPSSVSLFETEKEKIPVPSQIVLNASSENGNHAGEFIAINGGKFHYEIEHKKRESGCYPFGGDQNFLWGWYYEDLIKHVFDNKVSSFHVKKTAVTNQEFLNFIHESHYLPKNPDRFLAHIKRNTAGDLPKILDVDLASLPVTYINLDDANAYASWRGEHLLSEEEWQYVASGAGANNLYPFGMDITQLKDPKRINLSGKISSAYAYPLGQTPQGVLGLSGNTWELTNTIYDDGHNKFVMLRGGSYLPSHQSTWIIPRGPRSNNYHAKYLLTGGGIDRSESISFRTAY